MCDGPRAVRDRGPLPPPPPRPRGCGANVCPCLPVVPPSFAAQRCAANGLSAPRGRTRLPDPTTPGPGKGGAPMASTGTSFLSASARRVPWSLSWGSGSARKRGGLFGRGGAGRSSVRPVRGHLNLVLSCSHCGSGSQGIWGLGPHPLYKTSSRRVTFLR